MRLLQYRSEEGQRQVGVVASPSVVLRIAATDSVYALAHRAAVESTTLSALASEFATDTEDDYDAIVEQGRLLPPLDHPVDPAHCMVSGTGLTHLGIGDARARLAAKLEAPIDARAEPALALLAEGYASGKTGAHAVGPQPEWFYKGDGAMLVAGCEPLVLPTFARSGGDEAEVAALYVISPQGYPCRVGYALANEFSDHRMEHQNALYMGHSKLRQCAVGPELLLGELPGEVRGESTIYRHGQVLWRQAFASGADPLTHTLANLEHHHFKYPQFRRPGDVHIPLLGAAASSSSDGIETAPGDVFEIRAEGFGRPLENALAAGPPLEFGVIAL